MFTEKRVKSYCDGFAQSFKPWSQINPLLSKHIIEVTQSAIGPRLLSSQRFGEQVFVTTNNLHGYERATKHFQ